MSDITISLSPTSAIAINIATNSITFNLAAPTPIVINLSPASTGGGPLVIPDSFITPAMLSDAVFSVIIGSIPDIEPPLSIPAQFIQPAMISDAAYAAVPVPLLLTNLAAEIRQARDDYATLREAILAVATTITLSHTGGSLQTIAGTRELATSQPFSNGTMILLTIHGLLLGPSDFYTTQGLDGNFVINLQPSIPDFDGGLVVVQYIFLVH